MLYIFQNLFTCSQLSRFYRLTNQGAENTCIKEIEGTSRSFLPSVLISFSGTHLLSSPSVLGPGWGLRYEEDAWPGRHGVQRPQGTEALVSQPEILGDLAIQRGHLFPTLCILHICQHGILTQRHIRISSLPYTINVT